MVNRAEINCDRYGMCLLARLRSSTSWFYMALGPWSLFSHRHNGQIFFDFGLYASRSKFHCQTPLQQQFFTASVQHGCKTAQLKGSPITLIRHRAATAPMKPQEEEIRFVSSTGGKAPTTVLLIETSCHSLRI